MLLFESGSADTCSLPMGGSRCGVGDPPSAGLLPTSSVCCRNRAASDAAGNMAETDVSRRLAVESAPFSSAGWLESMPWNPTGLCACRGNVSPSCRGMQCDVPLKSQQKSSSHTKSGTCSIRRVGDSLSVRLSSRSDRSSDQVSEVRNGQNNSKWSNMHI